MSMERIKCQKWNCRRCYLQLSFHSSKPNTSLLLALSLCSGQCMLSSRAFRDYRLLIDVFVLFWWYCQLTKRNLRCQTKPLQLQLRLLSTKYPREKCQWTLELPFEYGDHQTWPDIALASATALALQGHILAGQLWWHDRYLAWIKGRPLCPVLSSSHAWQ